MLARCARCHGTFSTDRFGILTCPHCGSELLLADPNAPPGAPPPTGAEPPAPPAPPEGAPPASAAPPEGAPPQPPGAGASGPVWGAPPPPPEPPPEPPSAAAPPPPSGGWRGPPGAAPGDRWEHREAELPAPFVERRTRGFFTTFFETWKLAAVEPARFFRWVRVDQTAPAVWFAVIAGTIGTWIQIAFSSLSAQSTLKGLEEMLNRMPGPGNAEALRMVELLFTGRAFAAAIVATPLLVVVRLYLAAAVFHVVLVLLRGGRRGFGATLTVTAYASGLFLLDGVPGCGGIVAPIWFAVSAIVGLAEAQRCGTGKATVAVLSPIILACVCCFGLVGPGIVKGVHDAAQSVQSTGPTTTL